MTWIKFAPSKPETRCLHRTGTRWTRGLPHVSLGAKPDVAACDPIARLVRGFGHRTASMQDLWAEDRGWSSWMRIELCAWCQATSFALQNAGNSQPTASFGGTAHCNVLDWTNRAFAEHGASGPVGMFSLRVRLPWSHATQDRSTEHGAAVAWCVEQTATDLEGAPVLALSAVG